MVLLEFSITPIGRGESVSPYVARCLDLVERSGLDYRLHAMGTILEGEWDEVMALLGACFRELARDCPRLSITAKMDYRKGEKGRLREKVASVERRLGRELKGV